MTSSLLRLRRFGNAAALTATFDADPALRDQDFLTQQAALDRSLGPFSAPLTAELSRLGWQASDLILGVPSIREAWVRQHGPLPRIARVEDPDVLLALGEIIRLRPEVVVDSNLNVLDRTSTHYLRRHVPDVRLLVGQMGTAKRFHRALHVDLSLVPCETLATTIRPVLPGSVQVLPHSFNPAVLSGLPEREVEHPLVFAGALGPRYVLRHAALMALLEQTPIEAWIGLRKGVLARDGLLVTENTSTNPSLAGRIVAAIPAPILAAVARHSDRFGDQLNTSLATRAGGRFIDAGPLEDPSVRFPDRCHPQVGGREYFELLRRSGTVLHREGDELDGCGAALRLFEVTGLGATLLTDDSSMVRQLFADGEIVTFDGVDDCVEKARWLLDNPSARDRIAAAGQARTLRDHTTAIRAAKLSDILSDQLSGAR